MYQNEFSKLGIEAPNKVNGIAKVHCPKCEIRRGTRTKEKDLYLNYDSGVYRCYSGKCGWKGKVSKTNYSRPDWKNKTDLPAKVVKYFEGRGISQKTLKDFQISIDERGNIEFNYFRGDELINVKTRFEIDGKKSFKQHAGAEKIVFNLNSLDGKEKCIVVEGEMDVLSWHEAGISSEYAIISVDQGAPAPGQKVDGKLECFSNSAIELDSIKEFYICTDKDAPGQYLQQELIRRLGEYRCSIIDLPKGNKDANDVLQNTNYPISTRKETLRFQLKNARPVPVPGIHTLDQDTWDLMEDYYHNGRPKGLTTHFKDFDYHFTFLKGDVTVITGLPNDGKSQFLRQLAVIKSKFDGWKWACYVPEDFPVDMFYDDICHIYIGKSPYKGHENQMSIEEYNEAREFARSHFFCIYPEADKKTGMVSLPTNSWINKRISFLKLKHGVNAYIKDPWNKIFHEFNGREDQYLASELSKEKFFAAQFDACLYVAHPGKMSKNGEGKYPAPDVYDISGGSMWNNMVDNILVVYRPHRHENPTDKIVEVKSMKIKKQKLVGKLGSFEFFYEVKENRYYELGSEYNPMEDKKAVVAIPDGLDDIPWDDEPVSTMNNDEDIPF